jgi:hypothetical protein
MMRALRAGLYLIALLAALLGLWGIISNFAISWMPAEEMVPASSSKPDLYEPLHVPWWAISLQTQCPYLDPWLGGPVGYGFYGLCLAWGLGTVILLRWYARSGTGRVFWPVILFWLGGLVGIVGHVAFFASIAREAARAGRM